MKKSVFEGGGGRGLRGLGEISVAVFCEEANNSVRTPRVDNTVIYLYIPRLLVMYESYDTNNLVESSVPSVLATFLIPAHGATLTT